MSVRESTIEEDLTYYDDLLAPIYFKGREHLINELRGDVINGVFQIETMHEQCLIMKSEGTYGRDSVDGRDFTDGSDAKKITSRMYSKGKRHGGNIKLSDVKEGLFRITLLNKKTRKFHFFAIPHCIYSQYKDMNIDFNNDGSVKKTDMTRHNSIADLSLYEVESFERLATITHDEAIAMGFTHHHTNYDLFFMNSMNFINDIDPIDELTNHSDRDLIFDFDDLFTIG